MIDPKTSKKKSALREWAESFAFALGLVVLFYIFFSNTQVFSYSMQPTLLEGDHLLLWKHGSLERGDIVTFHTGEELSESDYARLAPIQKVLMLFNRQKTLVKRVIGLPGETVQIQAGSVLIDGIPLEEPYLLSGTEGEYLLRIPPGQYLLLGDNRQNSYDSRDPRLGPIDESDIIGKALLRYWPLSKFTFF